jgi:hypothetical protein
VFGVLTLALVGVVGQGSSCDLEKPDLEGMFDCDPSSPCCDSDGTCMVGSDCFRGGADSEGSCTFGAGGGMGMGSCFCGEKLDPAETEFYDAYRSQNGGPHSRKDAFVMFSKGCRSDVGSACLYRGLMLANGDAGKTDYPAAARSVEYSCALGHATGCFYYGAALRLGVGVDKNLKRAERYFERACKGGEPFGCSPDSILDPIASGTPQATLDAVADRVNAAHPSCE